MSIQKPLSAVLGILCLFSLGLWPVLDLPFPAQRVLGIVLFALIFWMTEPIRIEHTSLLVLVLLAFTGVLSFEKAFAGFSTRAFWLIFSGMILSLGITETTIGQRLAFWLLHLLGGSYIRLIFGLNLLGSLLAFFIPSGLIRVLILVPVGIRVSEAMGFAKRSRESAAVILSLICGTNYPSAGILTASLPNIVILGVVERELNQTIGWGEWIYLMFPTMGLLRLVLTTFFILLFFRLEPEKSIPVPLFPALPALTAPEKRALGFLGLAIALWATDFLHQIHPTYVGLGIVVLYFLPSIGVFSFEKIREVNFPILFYIAAFLAIGAAFQVSGFNAVVSAYLLPLLDIGQRGWFIGYYMIILLTLPFTALMDTAAVAGVLTPLILLIAQEAGLPPVAAALTEALGTALVFLPYQAAPFMIAYGFGHLNMGWLLKVMVAVSVTTLLVLAPLTLLYWRLIGFL